MGVGASFRQAAAAACKSELHGDGWIRDKILSKIGRAKWTNDIGRGLYSTVQYSTAPARQSGYSVSGPRRNNRPTSSCGGHARGGCRVTRIRIDPVTAAEPLTTPPPAFAGARARATQHRTLWWAWRRAAVRPHPPTPPTQHGSSPPRAPTRRHAVAGARLRTCRCGDTAAMRLLCRRRHCWHGGRGAPAARPRSPPRRFRFQ